MKGWLRDKKACEYVLLDVPIKPRIKKAYEFLKETKFIDEFKKNTEKSSRIQALIGYGINQKDILGKDIFKKIVYKDNILHLILTFNVPILYLLEQYKGKYDSILSFLCGEKIQESKVLKSINSHLAISCGDNKIDYLLTFFLALKWFYSEKTKHLYSKELLEAMAAYEKEVRNLDLKKLEESNPRFSKFRMRV
ncbi:MAG: hypothetical protein ABIE94_02340 [archaeon]